MVIDSAVLSTTVIQSTNVLYNYGRSTSERIVAKSFTKSTETFENISIPSFCTKSKMI